MGIFSDHNATNDFWETAAEKSKLINHDKQFVDPASIGSKENHFARIIESGKSPFQPLSYVEEVIEENRDSLHYPALVAESTQESIAKPGSSLYSTVNGAIIILQSSGDNGDYDSKNTALTECCLIADKMFGYLRNYLQENPTEGKLDFSRSAIYKIGPVLDQHFGARLEYSIKLDNPGNRFCYDAGDWN